MGKPVRPLLVGVGLLFLPLVATAALAPAAEAASRVFCPADGPDTPPRKVVLRQTVDETYLSQLADVGVLVELAGDEETKVAQRGRMRVTVDALPLFGPAIRLAKFTRRQDAETGVTSGSRTVPVNVDPGTEIVWTVKLRKYADFDQCVELVVALFDPALDRSSP